MKSRRSNAEGQAVLRSLNRGRTDLIIERRCSFECLDQDLLDCIPVIECPFRIRRIASIGA